MSISEQRAQHLQPPPTEGQLAWLAMELTSGVGWIRAWKAVDTLGSAEALWQVPMTRLNSFGIPNEAAQELVDGTSRSRAVKEWEAASAADVRIVTPSDVEYPERLREIYDPPLVLWCRGDVSLLRRPGIAVVGTRSPTPYGSGMAEMLSRDLAARGVVIFSGMARGVDSAAHKGALIARGKTVAVWGTGVDVVYPKENRRLAEDILAAGGTIVSEFPMGTYPATQNFPIRNRVLSGMSVGVLVVEGSEQSGTRITARCAVEQNRELFAVPGNVTSRQAWAPNTLIKQGAKLTATWEDIWDDLPMAARVELTELAETASRNAAASGTGSAPGGDGNESGRGGDASLYTTPSAEQALTGIENAVYTQLKKDQATQLDELIEVMEGRMTSSEIFAALFELELGGKVRQLPGKKYVKTF